MFDWQGEDAVQYNINVYYLYMLFIFESKSGKEGVLS